MSGHIIETVGNSVLGFSVIMQTEKKGVISYEIARRHVYKNRVWYQLLAKAKDLELAKKALNKTFENQQSKQPKHVEDLSFDSLNELAKRVGNELG